MLDKIKQLESSLSFHQEKQLKSILGKEIYDLFDELIDSETEDSAREKMIVFVSAAKKSPHRMLLAQKILSEEQSDIIMDLADEVD